MIVGGRDCVHGFDWSYYQPVRDHRGNGQAFAVGKATEGDGFLDPRYLQHVSSFDDAGLVHGAYHFARPDWSDGSPYNDGRQEARLQLGRLAATERFIVLDLEATVLDAARTTEYVLGWLDEVIADGRFPIREQRVIYVGKFFNWQHAVAVAQQAVLWIPWYTAGYTPDVDPTAIPLPGWSVDLWPEGWALWQYSSSGTVAGVHPSDVNVAGVQWFNAVAGGPIELPEPFPTPEVTDMALPVFQQDGHQHYLADAGTGSGWRYIRGEQDANRLSIAGKINLGHVVTVGVGEGKPAGHRDDPDAFDAVDDTWNAYPVLDGPLERAAAA